MEEVLVEKVALENGLTLELFDRSRRVAGDRWLVHFVGRVVIDVSRSLPRDDGVPALEAVQEVLGETIDWSFEKKSHFVDESEKDGEFDNLKKAFVETNLEYLSRPEVPGRLILSRYREKAAGRRPWKVA